MFQTLRIFSDIRCNDLVIGLMFVELNITSAAKSIRFVVFLILLDGMSIRILLLTRNVDYHEHCRS